MIRIKKNICRWISLYNIEVISMIPPPQGLWNTTTYRTIDVFQQNVQLCYSVPKELFT